MTKTEEAMGPKFLGPNPNYCRTPMDRRRWLRVVNGSHRINMNGSAEYSWQIQVTHTPSECSTHFVLISYIQTGYADYVYVVFTFKVSQNCLQQSWNRLPDHGSCGQTIVWTVFKFLIFSLFLSLLSLVSIGKKVGLCGCCSRHGRPFEVL